MASENGRERLIFALDMADDVEDILGWVRLLSDHVGMFKIGKEAFTCHGPSLVAKVRDAGGRIFLDLKYHDIPATVARASEAAVGLGVSMFNVHALGGVRMMKDAADAVTKRAEALAVARPVVLAVTVLTSLDGGDLADMGFDRSPGDLAVRLAGLAKKAGLDGVVASAHEVAPLRQSLGDGFIIVTPGIRSAASVHGDDQKRVQTAKDAVRSGADYVVVGRPIRTAGDPVEAARAITEEITEGLRLRRAGNDGGRRALP